MNNRRFFATVATSAATLGLVIVGATVDNLPSAEAMVEAGNAATPYLLIDPVTGFEVSADQAARERVELPSVTPAPEPVVLVCPDGQIEFNGDYTYGACSNLESGYTTEQASEWLGEPATMIALDCGPDAFVADDYWPATDSTPELEWAYCEPGQAPALDGLFD